MGAQGLEHGLEPVRGVGIVHIGLGTGSRGTHLLETARRAGQAFQGREDGFRRVTDGKAEARGGQGVQGLEGAGQGEVHSPGAAGVLDAENLPAGARLAAGQPEVPPLDAEGDQVGPSQDSGGGEGREGRGIGIEDRRGAPGEKRVKQPQLGRLVAGHVTMIVQVVLGQVEEGGGGEANAIEAALVDPVRGGLEGEVVYAPSCHLRHQGCDVAGVRRGQAGRRQDHVLLAWSRDAHAKGAHAGGRSTAGGGDLAPEAGHRGLAVGPGHSDHDTGLAAVEGSGGKGVGPAGILADDHRDAEAWKVPAAEYRGGTCGNGQGREVGPIPDDAGKGGKQDARADPAAVGRHAGDLRIFRQVPTKDLGQTHDGQRSGLAAATTTGAGATATCSK